MTCTRCTDPIIRAVYYIAKMPYCRICFRMLMNHEGAAG